MIFGDGYYISKSNRRGVLLLVVVIFVIAFAPRLYMMIFGNRHVDVDPEVRELAVTLTSEKSRVNRKVRSKTTRFRKPPRRFDPNSYTQQEWVYLGLSEKQANVVLNFTKRGIRSKEDLKKIFVISDELFNIIKDSLVFETGKSFGNDEQASPRAVRQINKVDVNLATKEELQKIPGIGEYISERIVSYRDRLGGFAYLEQLMELKKIDLELFARIEPYLEADQLFVKKINVNHASVEEFKSHPYISWNVANSIVKMRIQKGAFVHLDDLLESAIIDRELLQKIKPYLSL